MAGPGPWLKGERVTYLGSKAIREFVAYVDAWCEYEQLVRREIGEGVGIDVSIVFETYGDTRFEQKGTTLGNKPKPSKYDVAEVVIGASQSVGSL